MKRVVLYRIGAIVVIVIAILGTLMATTKMPNQEKNGFRRILLSEELPVVHRIQLEEKISAIVGASEHSLFLAGENPLSLLILNKDFKGKDTLFINANIPDKKLVPFRVLVDSPMLYIHFNNMKSVIYGEFPNKEMRQTEIKSMIFTKSLQIDSSYCIIRTFDSTLSKQVFQKISIASGTKVKEATIVNEQDSSAGMSTDGMLTMDKASGRIFYIEYLRNRFYCMDSGLNLLYKGNTIDTTSVNDLGLGMETKDDKTNKLVPSKARVKVNNVCFADKDHLYVVSALKADNEELRTFNTHISIDAYSSASGQYTGTYRLSKPEKAVIKSFIFEDGICTALFDNNEIIRYKL